MYFLKCNVCGHLNEVKTEYLTFCQSCNRKLGINFQEWTRRFPESSFQQYLEANCTTDAVEIPIKKEKIQSTNKLKIILLVFGIGIVFIGLIIGIVYLNQDKLDFFRKRFVDKALESQAQQANKSCPMMMGQGIRLDSLAALPDNILQINLSLISADKKNVDTMEVKSILQSQLLNYIKTNPSINATKLLKVSFDYLLRDKNGAYIMTIIITPSMYQ